MKDIKQTTIEDLKKMLDEKKVELHGVRYSLTAGRSKNVKHAKAIRVAIAQIQTELTARAK
jgi:ribosomal protein L29